MKLGRPKRVRFQRSQEFALLDISRRNHGLNLCKLNRIAVDFLIRLVDLNGGALPANNSVRVVQRGGKR